MNIRKETAIGLAVLAFVIVVLILIWFIPSGVSDSVPLPTPRPETAP